MNVPNKAAGAIFDAAIELPLEERAAYVQQACAGDEALRQRVEALLRANESAGTFMGTLAVNLDHGVPAAKSANQTGDKIGRYKLLQKIGEGGCGMVYMAEQEEPVRRRVALKIIKLGMDTKSVIARFEAERQALALMDHPNIAKVFDAGATQSPAVPGASASLLARSHPPDSTDKDAGASDSPHPASGHPLPSDGRGIKGEGA